MVDKKITLDEYNDIMKDWSKYFFNDRVKNMTIEASIKEIGEICGKIKKENDKLRQQVSVAKELVEAMDLERIRCDVCGYVNSPRMCNCNIENGELELLRILKKWREVAE